MNSIVYATYKQYLKETNEVNAAASLTLADANQTLADVMQRSLDAGPRTHDTPPAASLTLADTLQRRMDAETPATSATMVPAVVLTVKEAAARQGVSTDTIYAIVESGQLPCQRIGRGRGTIRIRPADLDEYSKGETPSTLRGVRNHPVPLAQDALPEPGILDAASGLVIRPRRR